MNIVTDSVPNFVVTLMVLGIVISIVIGISYPAYEEYRRKQRLRNRKRGNKK